VTCRELIEFLMEYTDGRLSPEVRAEFDRHLAICSSCVAYLDGYRKTVNLAKESLGGGGDEPVPDEVPKGLVKAIMEARKRGK
jgi:anti-sigma factor RsiW